MDCCQWRSKAFPWFHQFAASMEWPASLQVGRSAAFRLQKHRNGGPAEQRHPLIHQSTNPAIPQRMFEPTLNDHQRRVDRLQIAALCGLMLLGTAFVYSARMASETNTVWYGQSWVRQVVWYVMGTGAAVAVCMVDYRIIARWA